MHDSLFVESYLPKRETTTGRLVAMIASVLGLDRSQADGVLSSGVHLLADVEGTACCMVLDDGGSTTGRKRKTW